MTNISYITCGSNACAAIYDTASSTPSVTSSAAPTQMKHVCEDLKKKKKCIIIAKCVWGSKNIKKCVPKNKRKHDCSQYSTFSDCDYQRLCEMNDGVCTHIYEDITVKHCKQVNIGDGRLCYPKKIENPWKGCHPSSKYLTREDALLT